ncbi:MAG: peptidase M28, partial [Flavobacteriales bacterium]|nr:peptidase M28 [Flavobacteriales bacterium]
MIGYFSEEKGSQDYPIGLLKLFYPNTGNYISVVSKMGGGNGKLTRKVKKAMKKGSDIDVTSVNAPAKMPGIDFSDHLNYWKYDYPAVMITNTAFYRNKNYHEPGDLPETLDYIKMAEVIKGVYNAVITLE